MNFYEQKTHDAVARLSALLDLPPIEPDGCYSDGECFDPWDMFPSLYDPYSSEFDDLAIAVLEDVINRSYLRVDLAGEMFREMLCTSGLCEYGTSPRTCWAETAFAPLLPKLIERWREYAAIRWST